jgi:hypothetical protein
MAFDRRIMSPSDLQDQEERLTEFNRALKEFELLMEEAPGLLETLDSEDNIDSERVLRFVRAVNGFLHQPVVRDAFFTAQKGELGRQPINGGFLRSQWTGAMSIREYLVSKENLGLIPYNLDHMARAFSEAVQRNGRTQYRFLTPVKQAVLDQLLAEVGEELDRINNEERAERSVRIIEQAASQAVASADHASRAAGVTADAAVSTHFQTLGSREQVSSELFRKITLGAMALGGVLSALFIVGPSVGVDAFNIASGDYVHLGQKVLLVAAVFAFAAYTGRQAHNHRTMANWAESLAVQLQTFDAYCDAISDQAAKDELRKNFAARVFGDQPGLKGEAAQGDGDALVQKAADLVSKIMPGDKS